MDARDTAVADPARRRGPYAFAWLDSAITRAERARLVRTIHASRRAGPRVLLALARVPRHVFVPRAQLREAYVDEPLPIGYEQTISQPTVVAMMTEALDIFPGCRVLEVGTGSGYQAAILAEMGARVFSMEVVEPIARVAHQRLHDLGYTSVSLRIGDGYEGWPDAAPFDRVLVTAAPPTVPRALFAQLVDGGVLVIPVGETHGERPQALMRYERRGATAVSEDLGPVRFVPMVPMASARREPLNPK